MRDMPYFMNDEDWYEFDFKNNIWVLKEGAPPEAVESYKEYLEELKSIKNN